MDLQERKRIIRLEFRLNFIDSVFEIQVFGDKIINRII